jgi:hypothetical protein
MTHNSSRDVIALVSNCANLFDNPVVNGEHQLGAAVLGENLKLEKAKRTCRAERTCIVA